MAPRTTHTRLEGLRDLEKALGELPRATGKNVLRRVALARLEPMAKVAQAAAPIWSGQLQANVIVSLRQKTGRALRRFRDGKATVTAFMGPDRKTVVQGIMQEFGTKHHGPQPFMRPAWDAGKDALVDGIADDLKSEIDRAAARAARKQARLIARSGG